MRVLVVFILLAFGFNKSSDNSQQATDIFHRSKTKSCTSEAYPRTVDCCPLSVDYYESQIRKADSLYKNYLPQHNFDEVKSAVEFFDSLRLSTDNSQRTIDFFHRIFPTKRQQKLCNGDAYPRTVDCCPLSVDIDYQCAKAHYYHAVGLTEKDNIVGACEHYLIALEIMEAHFVTVDKWLKKKDADYENTRFVSLIYTRLGDLFLNDGCCDLAILNYRKALYFSDFIGDTVFKSNIIKLIGNAYQLNNKFDSALCYYNEALCVNSSFVNKLDIEKCTSQILFSKGASDSAYLLLKNNLNKINNENVKYSYHFTLGNMFYIDKEYDSALYYLEESLDKDIINKKIAFTTKLSSIYDSLGNYEKRAYYDNISSKLLVNNMNNEVNKSKLQILYEEYNERKQEKIKAITKKSTIILCIAITIIIFSIIITIRYNHKKHSERLSEEIMAKDKHIKHNEFKNALVEGKIKSKNAELKQKDKQIKSQQLKIAELQSKLENRKDNLKEYYQSEICAKILNEINELSKANKMTSELKPLSQEEFVMLLQSANLHLGEFIKNISDKYPSFRKDDLYYLCLVAINLNDKQIAALFNVTYNAVRSRRKKICTLLDIDINENIYKKLII